MTFNLRRIRTLDTFEFPVKDADGNPTGVVFTLAGPTHAVRQAQEQAKARRLVNEANKTGKVKLPDPAEAQAQRPAEVAALTLGWAGYVGDDGQLVPFSTEAARELYADPAMQWLLEQVEEALGNKTLFTKAASPN